MVASANQREGVEDESIEELERLRNESEAEKKRNEARAKREELLSYMNRRHAFIANYGGKAMVTDMQPDNLDSRRQRITFVKLDAIKARYANRSVPSPTGKDVEKPQELGAWWMKQPRRREYAGVMFQPSEDAVLVIGGAAYLNLWLGWGVKAQPGDWSLMRAHIRDVIADGDPKADKYIMRWCAWTVQNPDQPAEVALVLRGPKGTGKGTLTKALMRCFGMHGAQISDREHLTGKHNAHLHDCVLLVADEAYWAGDRRAEGALKRMITEETLWIEPKFVNSFAVRNMLHIIMTANEKWVVPASADERRFGVFDVSGRWMRNNEYFTALNAEINGGGVEAMLHDLLEMDLWGWHPREVYENEALRAQQSASLQGFASFYENVLQEGVLPGTGVRGGVVRFADLYARAKAAEPSLKWISEKGFAEELDDYGIHAAQRASDGMRRQFPPLREARASFAARFRGGWRWRNDYKEWADEGGVISAISRVGV